MLRVVTADVAVSGLAVPCFAAEKLIALTFDDGPRPYVLYGVKQPGAAYQLQTRECSTCWIATG